MIFPRIAINLQAGDSFFSIQGIGIDQIDLKIRA